MKTCFLFATLAATVCAQAPSVAAPPDTVVATVDGNKLTVGELGTLLNNSPALSQYFRQNPPDAIAQVYTMRYLAAEADKLKLFDETPWKEQLEMQRQELMYQAMIYYKTNHYQVKSDEIAAYYEANKVRFEQVKVKDIKISFKPGMVPSGTSADDLKKMAEIAVAAAHSATDRPEADAQKIADDLVKQLRNGGDFSKLVAQYSEDQETKQLGGEFGVIKSTSSYPADLKKAALALKAGDVSEPIKVGNVAFYILKAEERTFQPMAEVSETIVHEIRQQHVQQEVKDLVARFKPVIENPQVLMQFTSAPAGQAPPKK